MGTQGMSLTGAVYVSKLSFFFLKLIKIFLFILLSFIPYLSFFSHPAFIIIFSSDTAYVPTFKILDLNGHVKTHFNYVWCNPNAILWQVYLFSSNNVFSIIGASAVGASAVGASAVGASTVAASKL